MDHWQLRLRSGRHGALLLLMLAACGAPEPLATTAALTPASAAPAEAPALELVSVEDPVPSGGDGAPRMTLAWRHADGSRVSIAPQATAHAPFRDGVALVDTEGRLLLLSPDGTQRLLAHASAAPPVAGPRGELVYVVRHAQVSEVHVLEPEGRDQIVAGGLSSAGVLAPQRDGRLFFVAASPGGVAGLWLADGILEGAAGARCLTNCALRAGAPWGDAHVPLPSGADAIVAHAERVEWEAADGTHRALRLAETGAPLLPAPPDADRPGDAPAPAPTRGAP